MFASNFTDSAMLSDLVMTIYFFSFWNFKKVQWRFYIAEQQPS